MEDLTSDVQEAPEIFFRPALDQDLDIINRLEADGYPEDEAASPLQMEYRLKNAPEFFLCCEKSNEGVVGYVCGTLAPPGNNRLSEETMSSHHPDGTALCIHSVCVHRNHRRKGIATKLLRAYARYVSGSSPNVESMLLICKEPLVPLYEKGGFRVVGPSDVVHGADPWIEMDLKLHDELA